MTDRIIHSAWWMAMMSMICAAAVAGLFLIYGSLFEIIAGRWEMGLIGAALGIGCAMGTMSLCRHRDEIVRF